MHRSAPQHPVQNQAPAARLVAWGVVAACVLGVVLATHALPVVRASGLWSAALDRGVTWFAVAAGLSALALLMPRGAKRLAIAVLSAGVVSASIGWTLSSTLDLPPDRLDRILDPTREAHTREAMLIRVEGVVRTGPRGDPPRAGVLGDVLVQQPSVRFEIGVARLITPQAAVEASGVLSVRVDGDSVRVLARVGDTVRITGRFSPPAPPRHPGQPDVRPRLAMEGRVGWLAVPSPELIEPITAEGSFKHTLESRASAAVAGVRERVARPLRDGSGLASGSAGRALLAALLLGETYDPALAETRDAFRDAGAAHLLAISGFHLTILAGGLLVALRVAGDRGRVDVVIVAVFVILYVTLLPAKVPIVRAAMLALALILAELRGHGADRLTVLGWVTVLLIVWRPLDVFNLGAQLSVGITALLVWLGMRRPAWLVGSPVVVRVERSRGPWWHPPVRFVRTAAMTAVAAWLVAAPAIAWHTGTFSPLAPLAVLLLTPAVVGVLAFGFLAVLVGVVIPDAGAALGSGAAVCADVTATIARSLQFLPGLSVDLPQLSVWWAVGATLAAVQACRCRTWAVPSAWGPVAAVVGWAAVETVFGARLRPDVAMRIDTLAVGDGTCIVVRSGPETLLWDCGSLTPGLGERTLPEALRAINVRTIDAAVVTHANIDHYVYLPEAHNAANIGTLHMSSWTQTALSNTDAGTRLLAFALATGAEVETFGRGDALRVGDTRGVFLWPDEAITGPLSENDRAAVLRLEVETAAGPRSVLLTGDIQRAATIMLLSQPDLLDADVLELPHHGGWHDAGPAFVEAVSPTVVLQSTGPRRARASRAAERWGGVRTAIEGRGGAWWVTAEDGWAWVEILTDGSLRTGSRRR
ncbi:MAG: ComEC/Rec2 family competence protein [Planctomycetota bacterium]